MIGDLVRIESPSGDVAGIQAVEAYLAGGLEELGLAAAFHETPAGPILEVSRGHGGALLLGHADTVWPRGTLDFMPFMQEGPVLSGPGILDMKSGLVMALAAIAALDPAVPFTWLVTPDEEVGSASSRAMIEKSARRADLVLVLEAGTDRGALKIGRPGVGDFSLDITGVQSHAGLDPDAGASAIRELAQQILWLGTLENRLLGTTVNAGVVRGGTRANVMAGSAHADIDIRVRTPKEQARLGEILKRPPVFDERTSLAYVGEFSRPPMDHSEAAALWFARAARIWKEQTGQELVGANVGGASDGNYTAAVTPTLDGLGAVGAGAHARHEHIRWPESRTRIALIAALMQQAGRESEMGDGNPR